MPFWRWALFGKSLEKYIEAVMKGRAFLLNYQQSHLPIYLASFTLYVQSVCCLQTLSSTAVISFHGRLVISKPTGPARKPSLQWMFAPTPGSEWMPTDICSSLGQKHPNPLFYCLSKKYIESLLMPSLCCFLLLHPTCCFTESKFSYISLQLYSHKGWSSPSPLGESSSAQVAKDWFNQRLTRVMDLKI